MRGRVRVRENVRLDGENKKGKRDLHLREIISMRRIIPCR